jgi:hypothetical protein
MARRTGTGHRSWSGRGQTGASHLLVAAVASGLFLVGLGFIAVILWPRSLATTFAGAPSFPITIAGVAFNVPSTAIRVPIQRRAGAQERIDLAFDWPSLSPAESNPKILISDQPPAFDRMFVTIAASQSSIPPADLARVVYPRYLAGTPIAAPGGLAALPFRDDTPYEGEDLLYNPSAPGAFVARCSRAGAAATPGICLLERRIDTADVTVRFPRDWLAEWRQLAQGVDRLIAGLRQPGS